MSIVGTATIAMATAWMRRGSAARREAWDTGKYIVIDSTRTSIVEWRSDLEHGGRLPWAPSLADLEAKDYQPARVKHHCGPATGTSDH